MSVTDSVFEKLKSIVYGELDIEDIESKIDKLSDKLTDLKLIKNIELVRGLQTALGSKFNSILPSTQTIEPDRFKRYKQYDQLYQHVPELYQGLNIYVDNILTPDVITKRIIHVQLPQDATNESLKVAKQVAESIIKTLKLEDKAEPITKGTLKYGDFFVEIVDGNIVPANIKILHENLNNKSVSYEFVIGVNKQDNKLVLENVYIYEANNSSIEAINLILHNPKHVIAFYVGDTCLGFLVVKGLGQSYGKANIFQRQFADKFLELISTSQTQLKKLLDEYPGYKDDLKKLVATIKAEKLSIRFVPPDRMVHFKIPSNIFHPYGESIFTPITEIAKYVIASERAMLIYRLTRAPEKRLFKVNIFKDKSEIGEVLDEVIRLTKQKEVAVSKEGDLDALMSEITMFEDIYIPVIDGTPSFEVETLPGGDLNTKIEDLNYFKDKMIAGLGIPPIYLKPQDQQVDNKSTLAQENARFARTIIRYQKIISDQLKQLVINIANIIDPDIAPEIQQLNISFLPPTALMAERQQEIVSNVSQLVESLKQFGVPPIIILKKFLPEFDWDSIADKYSIDMKLNQISQGQGEETE